MEQMKRIRERLVHFWKKKHLTQYFFLIALSTVLIGLLFFVWTASRVNVASLKEGLSQPTVIYDKDADLATNVLTNRTNGMVFSDIPKHVTNAAIAIEDERFYEHGGFDVRGILRAFFRNLFAGSITGGGSTITQQLTKNALLSPEKTYKRKVEELFLAVKIEKFYRKDEILEMYLNQVYFGSGAWGMEQAAKKYFNKDLTEITIAEAATLAGLLQAPSALEPYQHYDRAILRRNIVLGKMHELGMISKKQMKDAKAEKIILTDGGGSFVKRKYPYYVDAVLDEAINDFGLTQEEILTRGYRIYTELDQNLQSSLETVYDKNYLFPGRDVQSSAVLLDPSSGGIRGIIGGRGEPVFRGYNRATQLKAQPGSTLKPLAVYTPALENGFSPTSLLADEKMSFGTYEPENFSKSYSGKVPMYKAVEQSLNVPAVWLLNQIGLQKGVSAVERYGIPVEKEDENLALALGGMHNGISPLQLASAFSAFPNKGKRVESHFITKIVGPTGDIIAEREIETVKVTSKTVAKKMTSMLLNVVESGTGQATQIDGIQVAGKTGSTQVPFNDINGTKDQWFVGYTPNLVGAVWLGYDRTDRQHYLKGSSSENVVPLFREILMTSKPYLKIEKFEVSSINTKLKSEEKFEETKKNIEEQVDKMKKELKQKTKKLEEAIKEESPKWKETIDELFLRLGKRMSELLEENK